MKRQYDTADVQMAVDSFVFRLQLVLEIQDWAGWITYILESLEENPHTEAHQHNDFLEELSGAITQRLEMGRW